MTEKPNHEFYMQRAISLAKEAFRRGEVPVGALVVNQDDQILAEAFNLRETEQSPTAHAEILALNQAAKKQGSWRLNHCRLYVTLEPCLMCAGAIINSRIEEVIFGASDPKAGAVITLYETLSDHRLNHRAQVISGVLEAECSSLLSTFFQNLRGKPVT